MGAGYFQDELREKSIVALFLLLTSHIQKYEYATLIHSQGNLNFAANDFLREINRKIKLYA